MKEFKFKVNGNEYTANVKSCDDENMVLELNGKEYAIELEKKEVVALISYLQALGQKGKKQ